MEILKSGNKFHMHISFITQLSLNTYLIFFLSIFQNLNVTGIFVLISLADVVNVIVTLSVTSWFEEA
jgi:hypothetical protein